MGRTWPTTLRLGPPVWLATVFAGMALRSVVGQGTALPFVIVATTFLGAALLGWRLVVWLLGRRHRVAPPRDASPPGRRL